MSLPQMASPSKLSHMEVEPAAGVRRILDSTCRWFAEQRAEGDPLDWVGFCPFVGEDVMKVDLLQSVMNCDIVRSIFCMWITDPIRK